MLDTPFSVFPASRRRRRRWMLAVAAAGLAVVVLAVTVAARASTSSGSRFRTAIAGRGDVTQTLDQVATVEPVVQASVAFPISGTVATVDVAVRDVVTTGDTLAALDTTSLVASLHEKEASLDSAQLTLERAENGESVTGSGGTMTGSGDSSTPVASSSTAAASIPTQGGSTLPGGADSPGSTSTTAATTPTTTATPTTSTTVVETTTTTISRDQLESYRAAVESAEAAVAAAEQDIAQATINSPIDGVVLAVTLAPGDSVSSGSTSAYVLIAGAGGYELTTKVSVDDLPDVKIGQPATIEPDGRGDTLTGHVASIAVAPDLDDTTSYTVIIAIDSGGDALRNGATASVQIVTKQATDAITVPTSAVQVDGSRTTVTVLDGDSTREVTVDTGAVGAELTEITSGVDVGTAVVLADVDEPLPTSATDSSNAQTGSTGFGGGGGTFTPPAGFGGGGGGFPR